MATTKPPKGCSNMIGSDYYFLCDTDAVWGIVLEALAAFGIVVTAILLFALLFLVCKVQDNTKRKLMAVQFLFLLSTLGIFGLTFAFIIRLNERTAPTRFFLFGVLFALCFACLLAHAFNLINLVRGRKPFSGLVLLIIAISLTVVQIIIAVQYVAINIKSLQGLKYAMSDKSREDFVLILIYVLFLMALLFVVSMFTFCGSYKRWKRHGAHIFLTVLFSICIWIIWICMLLKGNPNLKKRPVWDDPVLSITLVVNGWVFLIMYAIPELCFLTAPQKPGDYPPENNFCQPKVLKKAHGVDNQGYMQESSTPAENRDHSYAPYTTHFQLQNLEPQQDFSIPRPKTRTSPYQGYSGGKGDQ